MTVIHPVRISDSAWNSRKLICCHGYLVTANSTFHGPPRNPIRQLISMMPLSRRRGESGGVDFMSSLNSLAPDSHKVQSVAIAVDDQEVDCPFNIATRFLDSHVRNLAPGCFPLFGHHVTNPDKLELGRVALRLLVKVVLLLAVEVLHLGIETLPPQCD